MNPFKEKCIKLRKQGYTLKEIMLMTGKPKTSVYFHISDIPLSQSKIDSIKKAAGIRAKRIAEARKGKSIRTFKQFKRWTPSKVSLVSHLIFDGTIDKKGCAYNNRNDALLNKVKVAMTELYDYEPKMYVNKLTGVNRISYHNVALANFLNVKSAELISKVSKFPKSLKIEFLRAFFDDEGCMDFRPSKNRRSIRGYQKNVELLQMIKLLLVDLSISSRIIRPNEVVITGKENLLRFKKHVNFSPGVYINGNRSNSTWKKHLEKRVLLDQAIKSFKT
ncbi:MAG: LAGLIDADG family homing endonuclease [Parcubacteria group bacterium]